MRNVARCIAVTFLLFSSFISFGQTFSLSGRHPKPEYVPGQVLVRFRPGRSASDRLSAHARTQATVRRQYALVPDLQLVSVSPKVSVEAAVAAYRSDPNVLYAEPNYIRRAMQSPVTPNDPMFTQMWSLHNTGANAGVAGADIKAPEAWTISKGSANVVVAVIDTGIDYTHPDLQANIWNNTADCNTNGVDDDNDGYVDDCHGIDTANHDSDPMDDHGHGTHVAGTIGAVGNNSVGVVGVNWTTTIIGCKFLGADGFGSDSGAIECLNYLAKLKQRGVNIVATNNSWGGAGYSQALHDAIQANRDLGILFIAAAGNSASDNDTGDFYPANYNLSNIVSVAATDRTDELAFFSDFGKHTVHIGAPGHEILSTYPGNDYATMSGTSMATPHVTGAVALLAAAHPELDWKGLKNRIISSGDAISALKQTVTGRRLNAHAALTCSNSEVLSSLTTNTRMFGSVGKAINLSALHINCELPAGPVSVTIEPGGITVPLTDDGTNGDEVADDGIYSATWAPSAPGIYTYSLAGETGTIIVDPYTPSPVDMQWRDITGNSTGLSLSDSPTWGTFFYSPFPISIAGRGAYGLMVYGDGYIQFPNQFGTPPSYALPMQADMVFAPFATRLAPDGLANVHNVFWGVLGEAPNRELVVEWRDLRHSDCSAVTDGGVTFQTVFFENSPNILYNYKDTVFGGNCTAYDNGAGESVGLQVGPASAVQYSYQEQKILDNTAILWKLNPDFPPNPVPALSSIEPPFFVASTYFAGAFLVAHGSNATQDSLFLFDGSPRMAFFMTSGLTAFELNQADLAQPHTAKAALFNALPGGGASAAINYEIKRQDFTIGVSSTTVDLTTTATGTVDVTLQPVTAVIDPIDFTCTSSDPKLTCSFIYPELYGSFQAPVTSTLTIQRAGTTSIRNAILRDDSPLPQRRRQLPPAGLLAAAGLSLFGFVQLRGSRRRLTAILGFALLLVAFQFACGGGNHYTPPPTPPTASLTATPASIGAGQSSTLSWSTTNATAVTLDGATVQSPGTKTVSPAATTTYTLSAQGPGGTRQSSATVTVLTNTTTATVTVKVSTAGIERTADITVRLPA
jgi:subtilisin family serine protease